MKKRHPNCPLCDSEYVYKDGATYLCPECSFKWKGEVSREKAKEEGDAEFAKIMPIGSRRLDGASCALMNELKQNDSSILVQEHTARPRLWGDQFDFACGM